MNSELSIENEAVKNALASAEVAHVRFLRAWADEAPARVVKVVGVNILYALNYELIQLINNAFLAAFINEQVARETLEVSPE